jgi:hypothetical protein
MKFYLTTIALSLILCASANLHSKEKNEKKIVFYEPVVGNLEGWAIEWDPKLAEAKDGHIFDEIKKALSNHFQRIKYLLPKQKVRELQNFTIRVDQKHELSSMQYHPSKRWLVQNGYDPKLEKKVHIPRAENLLKRSTWQKHPYVILHELAHAYHDQVLNFENMEIIEAYRRAEKEKIYEKVLLFKGGKTSHYARTNHKEFFAEMTESYVGVNDFYPFVRAELKEHDPKTYSLMEKIWGKF